MKRLLAFALALALFAAPAVVLAENYNRTAPGADQRQSLTGPPFGEVSEHLKSLIEHAG